MKSKLILLAFLFLTLTAFAGKKVQPEQTFTIGSEKSGTAFVLRFEKGKQHNHPLFAVWLADLNGKYLETLYVSRSIGKGVFPRADRKTGAWQSGPIQRPAALPYWSHQRNIPNEFGGYNPTPAKPETDGNTGATPQSSFVMYLKSVKALEGSYRVFVELNQSWDWNEFWYNDRFPGNKEYMTSSQPALVYSVLIDTRQHQVYPMSPVGYSSYDGSDGSLTSDLSSITTALRIAKSISVEIR
jgi:hypothetical protein